MSGSRPGQVAVEKQHAASRRRILLPLPTERTKGLLAEMDKSDVEIAATISVIGHETVYAAFRTNKAIAVKTAANRHNCNQASNFCMMP